MKALFARLGRILTTLILVAVAAAVGWRLWIYYMDDPWTRDGRVRAEVVSVAPDVSGLVTDVDVEDNEVVKKGQVLFRIDRDRFTLALAQAEAIVASRRATMDQANRDAVRLRKLDNSAISVQQQEQSGSTARVAAAAYQQALVDRDTAQLNLVRSEVRAPVSGIVANLGLRPGDYLSAGKTALALVDTGTLHIDGYFEETKLPRIHPGDAVRVRLMGETHDIYGRVNSIAPGIVDRERSDSSGLLANVNPTFSWVRLAQRVPVRISIQYVPPGVRLVAGRTASVTVLTDAEAAPLERKGLLRPRNAPDPQDKEDAAPAAAPATAPGNTSVNTSGNTSSAANTGPQADAPATAAPAAQTTAR